MLTEQCKLTQVFATSQDGNLCENTRLLGTPNTESGVRHQSREGRSWVLVTPEPLPSRSGGADTRRKDAHGRDSGDHGGTQRGVQAFIHQLGGLSGQTLRGVLETHGNYDRFILMEPVVWKGQSLSSSHSAVSAPQRRTFGVLGESKAGGHRRPESQGRLLEEGTLLRRS